MSNAPRLATVATALTVAAVGLTIPSEAAARAPSAVRELWTRYGTGLVTGLAIADLDGDGQGALVVGGRGVGTVGAESVRAGRFRWANKWEDAPDPPGDAETALDLRTADVTGDGIPDALAGNGDGLFAIDGVTGETLWIATGGGLAFNDGAWDLDMADFDLDGVADAAFGDLIDERISGVDGPTGALLWYYPRDGSVADIAAGDVDGDGRADVVVVGGAGFEVQAIDGGTMDSGQATALWQQQFPGSDPRAVVIGQVVAATPEPEVVVGGTGGYVQVFDGGTGAVIGSGRLDGGVAAIALANLDADPDLEVVAANDSTDPGGSVDAFDPDGTLLWTVPTPGAANDVAVGDLDGDGRDDVVAVGGWAGEAPEGDAAGFAMALHPGTTAVERWSADLAEYASHVVVGTVFGRLTVAVGQGQEGGVHAFDGMGRTRWSFRTGGRVEDLEAADLDGDGVPEVIEGADDSMVAVSDARGRLRWAQRVPGEEGREVLRVGAGNLTSSPGLEVVAGTWEFDLAGPGGRLHAYSAGGEPLWSRDLLGAVFGLSVADLESDGATDVVVATSTDGSVARLDGAGAVVWETALETGTEAGLALMDANGDGVLDPIVTRKSLGLGTVYALDGTDGALLWQEALPEGINWVSATSDGVVTGDLTGNVYRLRATDGAEVWHADIVWSSWDGEWSVDGNGGGTPDVATVSEDGYAYLLDGGTGAVVWKSDKSSQAGLRVATVQTEAGPRIVMGTYPPEPIGPSMIRVFDAFTGQRTGRWRVHSMVLDLAPADLDGDGGEELLAGAGWQVQALDVGSS